MIVGTITAYEHRGWLRLVVTANTGEVLAMDLDATDAMIFAFELEVALATAPDIRKGLVPPLRVGGSC
jgi:hypothetical protein